MNNLNSILIEGNLVRDPAMRHTAKGTAVTTFIISSNRFFEQDAGIEKEVSFFSVEAWSKLGESAYNLGKKGREVRVVGRLKQDRWTGSDGKLKSRIFIVAEHIEYRSESKKESKAKKDIPEPEYVESEDTDDEIESLVQETDGRLKKGGRNRGRHGQ